jgi:magnesium transporter
MAITGSHEAGTYLKTPSWVHFRNRVYWITGLAAVGLVSGMVIHEFEATLMNLLILALYMPMVADTGGNTGSQSATVVVRALALGEISPKDTFRILWKEFKISVLLAVVLGLLSFGKIWFLSADSQLPLNFSLGKVGLAIALALSMQVVTATLIGAVLPLVAARLKFDPAVVASPALTTIVDITGLLIYFGTAKALLGV